MTTDDRCKCTVFVTVHVCLRFPSSGSFSFGERSALSTLVETLTVFLPLLLACTLVFRDSACLAEVEENSLGVKVSGSVSVLVSASLWSVLALGLGGGLVCETALENVSLLALLGSAPTRW